MLIIALLIFKNMLNKIKHRVLFLDRISYCPICSEDLCGEPFCSKHGDVSGQPLWKYTWLFKLIPSWLKK